MIIESVAPDRSRQRRRLSRALPAAAIMSLVLGLLAGTAIRSASHAGWAASLVDIFDIIGTMWVDAIRMTVIPLIVPLLIGSIAGAQSGRAAGRLGLTTIASFLGLAAFLSLLAAIAAPLLFKGLRIDPNVAVQLRAVASTALPTGDASLGGWFRALIPTNPIKSLADGSMLSIVLFAVAFGFATLAAPEEVRRPVVRFANGLSLIMLVMVQAVLLFAPIGVFALSLVVGAKVGGVAFGAFGYFVVVDLLVGVVFVAALFGSAVLWGGLSAGAVYRGAAPAVMVGAGTSSSLSALPAMIEGARDQWGLPENVYGFVLPLAVSTFKPTSAFTWVIGCFFVATLYGMPLGPGKLAMAAGYTILLNATVPGIPGGGIIVASSMFLALGLPTEGLAIMLAINPIIDRFSTVGNVAADMAMTAIISRRFAPLGRSMSQTGATAAMRKRSAIMVRSREDGVTEITEK